MIIINILIWIWVITFLINTIWFQHNSKHLNDLYRESNLLYSSDYSYFIMIFHIAMLIIAPIVFYYVIIGELRNYITIWNLKRLLKKNIKKIKNKKVKNQLKEQINNIKY